MPTYSYHCGACGADFDKVQRITEDPLRVCETCGAEAASRVINSANFILKGSGWYSDLYSGGSNKKHAAGSSGSSTESKPAGDATATSTGGCAAPAVSPAAGTTPAASAPASTPSTSGTSN